MGYHRKDGAVTGAGSSEPRPMAPVSVEGSTPGQPPRLLDQVRARCRALHYSLRTERAYVGWARRFILANGRRHPRDMGAPEVEAFLSMLAVRDNVAANTQNQALSSLLFLYKEVLRVELPWMESVTRAKRPKKLPVVLSRDEARRLLALMDGRPQLMASLLYGAGMRLMECVRLRVKDVDFARGEILVRNGKGGKDRRVPLPRSLRDRLEAQLARVALLHAQDLARGAARCGCRTRCRASIPTRRASRGGNTCFRRRGCRRIRAPARCAATMSTRAFCSARSPRRGSVPGSSSRRPATRCAIRSPPT